MANEIIFLNILIWEGKSILYYFKNIIRYNANCCRKVYLSVSADIDIRLKITETMLVNILLFEGILMGKIIILKEF